MKTARIGWPPFVPDRAAFKKYRTCSGLGDKELLPKVGWNVRCQPVHPSLQDIVPGNADKSPFVKVFRDPTSPIVWANGYYFITGDGKVYLDCESQTQNVNLGHNFPGERRVVQAFAYSMSPHYTSSRFGNPQSNDFAAALIEAAPAGLNRVNLKMCNGSDANEIALKTAFTFHYLRGQEQKNTVVSFMWSHHGESAGAMNVSGKHFQIGAYINKRGVIHIDPVYSDESRAVKEGIERFKKMVRRNKGRITAFIMEPVLVNGGLLPLNQRYLKQIAAICQQEGICLIFDEIQTAFGWLGTMFAADYYGVTPDFMSLGKALANGWPMAGLLMRDKFDVLDYGEAEFTGGMNPLISAIGKANLDFLRETDILTKVREAKGPYLRGHLEDLKSRYALVRDVRGIGLLQGIELPSPAVAKEVYQLCLKDGVLFRVSKDGNGETILIKPSLLISKPAMDHAMNVLERNIRLVSAQTQTSWRELLLKNAPRLRIKKRRKVATLNGKEVKIAYAHRVVEEDVYYSQFMLQQTPAIVQDLYRKKKGHLKVLDLCCGTGTLGIVLAKSFPGEIGQVVASDINPLAVELTRRNVKSNGLQDKIDVREGNLFMSIREDEKFNLILCSPPQLPLVDRGVLELFLRRGQVISEDLMHHLITSFGGRTGRDVIDPLIQKSPIYLEEGGVLLFVHSDIAEAEEKTLEVLAKAGLKGREVARRQKGLGETQLTQRLIPYIRAALDYQFSKDETGQPCLNIMVFEGVRISEA